MLRAGLTTRRPILVLHSWIVKAPDMFKIVDNINALLGTSMRTWDTKLVVGGLSLGTVKIKRGIFQGDSLPPLLFLIALILLPRVLQKMKLGSHAL